MKKKLNHLLLIVFIACTAALNSSALAQDSAAPACKKRNVIFILTDDQRFDSMQALPVTSQRIFAQGIEFSHAYVTTPLCCPSRSSIFTGLYASRHGVIDNDIPLKKETIFQKLRRQGYYLGLVGKYLNSWDGTPRKEFDFWVSYRGGNVDTYFSPLLNIQGQELRVDKYVTDYFSDAAMDFLAKAMTQSKPYFLYLAVNAPHRPVKSAPRHDTLFNELEVKFPPSFGVVDQGKPAWIGRLERSVKGIRSKMEETQRTVLRALRAVDEMVARIVEFLERQHALDDTVIVFMSDNGVMRGEHNLTEKDVAYEEALHVPLAIRAPSIIATPRTEDRVVANIDLCPTFLELGCSHAEDGIDGRSLLPILKNESWDRNGVLVEGYSRRPYRGFHARDHVLINTIADKSELYDLKADPFQMDNKIDDPKYAEIKNQLAESLKIEESKLPPISDKLMQRALRNRRADKLENSD